MIINFTEEDRKAFEALTDACDERLKEQAAIIEALRPGDTGPDEEAYSRLQKKRPTPPQLPEPIEQINGEPVYSKDDMDAYYNSPEYQAYEAENKRLNATINKIYVDWYNGGSQEWKEARKKYEEIELECNAAQNEFLQKLEDRHFDSLGGNSDAIIKDALSQAERLLINKINYYDEKRAKGSFSANDIRVLDDGSYRLDTTEMRKAIHQSIERHIVALPDTEKEKLESEIERVLATSPFTSTTGKLHGKVEQTKSLTVTSPEQYRRPNNKVSNLLFRGELATDNSSELFTVNLNKDKTVRTYANFVVPSTALSMPKLDDFDERVYAAIGSCLFAGNNFIPFTMLYNRGILGLNRKEKNKAVSDDIKRDIIKSLEKFDGKITIDNDPDETKRKQDPGFHWERIKEPLLFYQLRTESVYGQVTDGIAIPHSYTPVLYRYAGNEIVSDPIETINVPGLNYTRDNIIIENAIYKRVKEIQYNNDKKRYRHEMPENKRTITYKAIAEKAGKSFADMTPTERNRLKGKIDKCMQSYQKSNLFARYEHKKDKNKTFYAVVLYFDELKSIPEAVK